MRRPVSVSISERGYTATHTASGVFSVEDHNEQTQASNQELFGTRVRSALDLPWKSVWNERCAENMHGVVLAMLGGIPSYRAADGGMTRGRYTSGWARKSVWTSPVRAMAVSKRGNGCSHMLSFLFRQQWCQYQYRYAPVCVWTLI